MVLPTTAIITNVQDPTKTVIASFTPITAALSTNNFGWWTSVINGTNPTQTYTVNHPLGAFDAGWNWTELHATYGLDAKVSMQCLVSPDNYVQGACMSEIDATSKAVHISRIATAPWNRIELTATPLWRGAGTALLEYCVAFSYSLGYGGKTIVSVVALPNTLAFYTAKGFKDTGNKDSENLPILELSSQDGENLLRKKGWLS